MLDGTEGHRLKQGLTRRGVQLGQDQGLTRRGVQLGQDQGDASGAAVEVRPK